MAKLDFSLRIIWLLIGILLLSWLGLVRAPQEWRHWQSRRATPTRTQRARPEPAIIVGEQAARDRADRIRRQTLRFGRILDPALQISAATDSPRSLRNDDWLLIPVELHTLAIPTLIPAKATGHDPTIPYTWQSITLWSSGPDGSDLELVWMPSGKVAPTRYREPMSGDLFGTLTTDTDADGEITADDRHRLFRVALGDTVARPVVSAGTVERIEAIVHGGDR